MFSQSAIGLEHLLVLAVGHETTSRVAIVAAVHLALVLPVCAAIAANDGGVAAVLAWFWLAEVHLLDMQFESRFVGKGLTATLFGTREATVWVFARPSSLIQVLFATPRRGP